VPYRVRVHVARDFLQRKAVGGAEGDDDAVLERCRLQLEVELAAEALAQGKPPGTVDARAEGRMDDEMLIARLVEEALEDDVVVRGQKAEGGARRGEVVDELPGRRRIEADLLLQPVEGRAGSLLEAPVHV